MALTAAEQLKAQLQLAIRTGRLDPAKDDPRVQQLQAWVLAQFEAGRQTSIEWEELASVVERVFPTATSNLHVP